MNKRNIANICKKLNIKFHTIFDVMFLCEKFSSSNTHQFPTEIMIATSIFLACKVQEEQIRIRDIVNVVYFEKRRKKIIEENLVEEKEYIEQLKKEDYSDNKTLIHTMYNVSLDNYVILKNDILSAEQHLLRILSYNLKKENNSYFVFCEFINMYENMFNESKEERYNEIIKIGFPLMIKLFEDEYILIENIFKDKFYYIIGILEVSYSIYFHLCQTKDDSRIREQFSIQKKEHFINNEQYKTIIQYLLLLI